jgi:hypothetical protein
LLGPLPHNRLRLAQGRGEKRRQRVLAKPISRLNASIRRLRFVALVTVLAYHARRRKTKAARRGETHNLPVRSRGLAKLARTALRAFRSAD